MQMLICNYIIMWLFTNALREFINSRNNKKEINTQNNNYSEEKISMVDPITNRQQEYTVITPNTPRKNIPSKKTIWSVEEQGSDIVPKILPSKQPILWTGKYDELYKDTPTEVYRDQQKVQELKDKIPLDMLKKDAWRPQNPWFYPEDYKVWMVSATPHRRDSPNESFEDNPNNVQRSGLTKSEFANLVVNKLAREWKYWEWWIIDDVVKKNLQRFTPIAGLKWFYDNTWNIFRAVKDKNWNDILLDTRRNIDEFRDSKDLAKDIESSWIRKINPNWPTARYERALKESIERIKRNKSQQ